MIDDDAATIIAVRSGTAAVRINIEDVATEDAVAGILIAFLRQSIRNQQNPALWAHVTMAGLKSRTQWYRREADGTFTAI